MFYSRRDFLKLSGSATLGFSLGLAACKQKYKPESVGVNDKINIGLVGCGQRGLDQIMKSIIHLNEYKLHSVCDVVDYQLNRVSQFVSYPVKKYIDYRELVLNPEIDLVIVATPLYWHFEVCKAALLAKKHVMCEKIMTFSNEQASELETLVNESGKLFSIAYILRSNPAYQVANDLVKQGMLGEIHHVNCTWNRNSDWKRTVIDPQKLVHFPTGDVMTRDKLLNWRMGTEFTAGIMSEILSHQIDAAQWILQLGAATQANGYGSTSFWKDGRTSHDNVHVNLKFENLIMSCNSVLYNDYEDYKLSIIGRQGTIVLGLNSGVFIPQQNEDKVSSQKLDAVTGASYKIIDKSNERKLKREDPIYEYYSQFVQSFDLATLMCFKSFANDIQQAKISSATVLEGKQNVKTVLLAANSII